MDNCDFCNVVNKKVDHAVYWEDDRVIAFLDKNPTRLGHTLLIPKDHINDIFNIDNNLYGHLFSAAKKLSRAIKEATKAKRVGMIVSGFQVPHAHIHLIPINSDQDLHSNPQPASLVESEQMAALLRNTLGL